MIIKKLTIKNFRSYYGTKEFEFSKRLNLIIGANGDGKTTFFDAIYWVLTTKDAELVNVPLSTYVSAKFFSELAPGADGMVLVSLDMLDKSNHLRTIEKSFEVKKTLDGKMSTDNFRYIGYRTLPNKSRVALPARDILEKEALFPAVIKKYCLFRGESELNIFNDTSTLKNLINLYSDVKDFDPFKDFASYAEGIAFTSKQTADKKKNTQNKKAKDLGEELESLRKKLSGMKKRRSDLKETYDSKDELIKAIGNDADTYQFVYNLDQSINKLDGERSSLIEKLDERYSIKLLDEKWILYGYQSILEEFSEKMGKLSLQKRNEQAAFDKELIKKESMQEAKKEVIEDLAKLPWNIPNIQTMKEMLHSHRCKVCNTEAPEGSAPYEYMKKRLEEALAHFNKEDKEEEKKETPVLFKESNIDDLYQLSMSMLEYGENINELGKKIEETFKKNQELQDKINEKSDEIAKKQDKIAEIKAQSASGDDNETFISMWKKIRNWGEIKEEAATDIKDLDNKIPELEEEIDEKQKKYDQMTNTAVGDMVNKIYSFFNKARRSIDNSEDLAFSEFLENLEKEANKYLSLLNVDDFTGEVNIYNNEGKVKLFLYDINNKRIERPNTSLETTMHISVLLAISELTKENRENEYPLIFDAPTSTFDSGKDIDFYECLNSKVDKQCIVVTKSYLDRDSETNTFTVNLPALEHMDCPIYRIKKKEGFDKKDLATIETEVELIKAKSNG